MANRPILNNAQDAATNKGAPITNKRVSIFFVVNKNKIIYRTEKSINLSFSIELVNMNSISE